MKSQEEVNAKKKQSVQQKLDQMASRMDMHKEQIVE